MKIQRPISHIAPLIAALLLTLNLTMAASAQSPSTLAQLKKLYVPPFAEGQEAAQLRQSLIRRLEKSGKYQLVDASRNADATVKGSGEIWIKGYVTTNTRTPQTNRQPVYGGFLSVEVVAASQEPLWSYLVTPSKFSWTNVRDNLANNLVKQMLLASAATTSAPQGSPTSAGALAATSLTGSGATFPAPLYRKWFATFEHLHPQVHIAYNGTGSEAGTSALIANQVDFAASDLSTQDANADPASSHSGANLHRIASVLGAVVPAYNLKGLNHDLHFTPEILAGIYLGRIRKWNAPEIRAVNKDANLPDADIHVIHRSDGSGTTYAWSEFLSKTNPDWKSSVGTGTELKWPTGTGVEGNEKIATLLQSTPNSIGYIELVYAIQHRLSFGAVRNRSGEFIHADLDSLAEAARGASLAQAAPSSIIDPPGRNAYPIATFTWLLLPEKTEDASKKAALLELLRWILISGQKECSSLGYAPLPTEIATRELETLNHYK